MDDLSSQRSGKASKRSTHQWTNYFFSIPDRMKKLYVQGLLGGSMLSISYLVDLDTILIFRIMILYYYDFILFWRPYYNYFFLYFGDFIMTILR